jgi:hypothetical protein
MIQLSLNTAAERAASLRALTVYVNALDAFSASGAATAAAFASAASAANDVAETLRSIRQSATVLPSMPAGGFVIPAADVPDVGAPLPPPVPFSASTLGVPFADGVDLTAEQVFGMATVLTLTGQEATDALFGQHAAPPLPATVVPTVPVAPVELDAEGKPWDPELHASSKAKIGDGTWRRKRNAAPAVPTPPVVPAAPAVPTPPVVPAAPVVSAVTVPELTQALMAAMMAQKIDGLAINALCQRHGVPNIVALSQHADKAAAIMADFRATVPA